MKNIYQALDNNGKLYALFTDKAVAIQTADSHFKDTAADPIVGDEYPPDTPVYDGNRKLVGPLDDIIGRRWGGPRKGAGRPRNPPLIRTSVGLTQEQREYLRELGGGVIGRGLRLVIEEHMKSEAKLGAK